MTQSAIKGGKSDESKKKKKQTKKQTKQKDIVEDIDCWKSKT